MISRTTQIYCQNPVQLIHKLTIYATPHVHTNYDTDRALVSIRVGYSTRQKPPDGATCVCLTQYYK